MANKTAKYPVSFRFQLSFKGVDAAFQEVSGISKDMSLEEVSSGGENRFKHRLPTISTSQNLILKRALIPDGSDLVDWCSSCMDEGLANPIETHDVSVSLLDQRGIVSVMWTFHNAYPVKYSISDLKSTENELAFETIELAYTYFEISPDLDISNLFP